MLSFLKRRIFLLFAFGTPPLFAGNIETQPHFNTLSIFRDKGSRVVFNFEMNLSLVMGKILDPQLSHEEFLTKLFTFSDDKFQKTIQIVQKELETKSTVSTPQGLNYNLINWQFPDIKRLWFLFSNESAYLKFSTQLQAHVDPVVIKAEIPASHAMQRARLTLPESLMPILVINGVHDKFWLSEQIPLAVLDIP